jgi:hypothetical protein
VVAANVDKRVLGAKKKRIRSIRAPQDANDHKPKMTHLYDLRLRTLPPRDVQQVWLEREGSQARRLQGLPPFDKVGKAPMIVLRVDLELKLADGKEAMRVRVDE